MTVNTAATLAMRKYYGGDASDNTGFDLRDFVSAINSAAAYKITMDCYQLTKLEGEWIIDSTYLVTYKDQPVLFNEGLNLYYTILPSEPLGLPRGRGVHLLCPMQAPQKPFMYMQEGEAWLFANLPATYTSFWYDTDKIYYKNLNPNINKVKLVMVPMTYTEIPDDLSYEIIDLSLTQFLKTVTRPQDKLDDQNSNFTGGSDFMGGQPKQQRQ